MRECHKCPERPMPGSPYEGSACESCDGEIEPLRAVSIDALGGNLEAKEEQTSDMRSEERRSAAVRRLGETMLSMRKAARGNRKQYAILLLRFSGMTYREIASAMSCNLGSIKWCLSQLESREPKLAKLLKRVESIDRMGGNQKAAQGQMGGSPMGPVRGG